MKSLVERMNTEPTAIFPDSAGSVKWPNYLEDADGSWVLVDCGLLRTASDYGFDVEIPADGEQRTLH